MSRTNAEIMTDARRFASKLGLVWVQVSTMRFAVARLGVVATGNEGNGHYTVHLADFVCGPCKYEEAWNYLERKKTELRAEINGREAAACILANPGIGLEDDRTKQTQAHPSAVPEDVK